MDEDDDDDDEWDDGAVEDWDEPESAPTRCIFTDQTFESPAECLAHAASAHLLDLPLVIKRLKLDIYGRVQLVNYLRHSVTSAGLAPRGRRVAVRGGSGRPGAGLGRGASLLCSHLE